LGLTRFRKQLCRAASAPGRVMLLSRNQWLSQGYARIWRSSHSEPISSPLAWNGDHSVCSHKRGEKKTRVAQAKKAYPTRAECLVMTQRAATCAADRCKQSSCPHADGRENHGRRALNPAYAFALSYVLCTPTVFGIIRVQVKIKITSLGILVPGGGVEPPRY